MEHHHLALPSGVSFLTWHDPQSKLVLLGVASAGEEYSFDNGVEKPIGAYDTILAEMRILTRSVRDDLSSFEDEIEEARYVQGLPLLDRLGWHATYLNATLPMVATPRSLLFAHTLELSEVERYASFTERSLEHSIDSFDSDDLHDKARSLHGCASSLSDLCTRTIDQARILEHYLAI